jgi:hypothetical protein
MNNNVQNVLQNLENDAYPYDPEHSWGIAIEITQNTPVDIFDICDTMRLKLIALSRYDELWNDPGVPTREIATPQLIINCVGGKWTIRLNSFDPNGSEKAEYCIMLEVTKMVVSTLLQRFVNRGIRVYDCMENTVL